MTRPGAAVATALALVAVCTGCSGPAEGSSATLRRLQAYDITKTPPGATQLAKSTDAGSNSPVTGKQPALQIVFRTPQSPQQVRDYYTATYRAYRLGGPVQVGATRPLIGNVGYDSVLVAINHGAAITYDRPAITMPPSSTDATYVTVFVIAGG